MRAHRRQTRRQVSGKASGWEDDPCAGEIRMMHWIELITQPSDQAVFGVDEVDSGTNFHAYLERRKQ